MEKQDLNAPINIDFSKGLSETKAVPAVNTKLELEEEETQKPRRGRPKEKPRKEGPSVRATKTPLNSEMSYMETYNMPANLVSGTIGELNSLGGKINQDIDYVRQSKTMKNKYTYISNLSASLVSVLSSKVGAIRELRGMITDANNFELKKQNQLKLNEQDSDDKIISDMYNAYLNMPMGNMPTHQLPSSNNSQFLDNGGFDSGITMATDKNGNNFIDNSESGYQNYLNNLTPEQNRMIKDCDTNIQTVLVYNQTDQSKWFEAVDVRTGEVIPNVALPSDFVRDGTTVDVQNGTARNAALNQTYRLKLVGIASADEF